MSQCPLASHLIEFVSKNMPTKFEVNWPNIMELWKIWRRGHYCPLPPPEICMCVEHFTAGDLSTTLKQCLLAEYWTKSSTCIYRLAVNCTHLINLTKGLCSPKHLMYWSQNSMPYICHRTQTQVHHAPVSKPFDWTKSIILHQNIKMQDGPSPPKSIKLGGWILMDLVRLGLILEHGSCRAILFLF